MGWREQRRRSRAEVKGSTGCYQGPVGQGEYFGFLSVRGEDTEGFEE